jgi:hypothetical protein
MKWFDRETYMREVVEHVVLCYHRTQGEGVVSSRYQAFWHDLKDIMEKHENLSARTPAN